MTGSTNPSSSSSMIAGAARRPGAPGGPTQGGGGAATVSLDPMRLVRAHYLLLIASVVVGVFIGAGAYFVLRETMPRFQAMQRFHVSPAPESAEQTSDQLGSGAGGRDEMEKYMQTQVVILESDDILRKVVEDRQVRETKWAQQSNFKTESGEYNPEEALRDLKKIVDARVLPETQLVQVSLSTFHRESAKTLVDAITTVYIEYVRQINRSSTQSNIDRFTSRVRDLSKQIQSRESQMENLLSEKQLTGLTIQESSFFNQVSHIQPSIVALNESIAQSKKQLDSYKQMQNSPGGPIIPEVIRREVERGPIIQELDGRIAAIEGSLESTRKLFGENHRDIKNLTQQLEIQRQQRDAKLQEKATELFNTAIESLGSSIDGMESGLLDLQTKLDEAKKKLNEVTLTLKQHEAIRNERDALLTQKANLDAALEQLNLLVQREGRVRQMGNSIAPNKLSFPQPLQIVPLGVLLVAGSVTGLIVLRELREQRIRGPQDVGLTRTAVLGMVPDLAMDLSNPERVETACVDKPAGAIAESMRQIRSRLLAFMQSGGTHRAIVIASGLPESGGSSVIANLAVSSAATDMRVLVIDANIRRPAQHKFFKVPESSKGVGDVLLGTATFDDAVQTTGIPNVSIITAGTKDHRVHERFMMPVMGKLIADAKERYDLVLVDVAPAVVGSDATTIARHCDGAALVVRALKETRGLLVRLRNQFSETRAEFLGVIVNGVRPAAGGYFKRNFEATHRYTFGEPAAPEPKKSKKKDKDKSPEPAATA